MPYWTELRSGDRGNSQRGQKLVNHFRAAGEFAAHRSVGAEDDASRFQQSGVAEPAASFKKAYAMNKNITTTVFGLTVIAALLTGCTAAPVEVKPTAPTATVAPSETPVAEEPAAPVAPVTGDIVDEATAAELKDANEGQRAYPLDDGTFVVVNKTEPLPPVVQADIDAKTAAVLAPQSDVSNNANLVLTAPGEASGHIAKNTGKRVIIAWLVRGYDGHAASPSNFWFVSGGPDMTVHYSDRESAQAGIDGWLAGKDDAATYAVVFVG